MFRLSAVQVSEQPGMSLACTVTLRCGKVTYHCLVESFLLTRCDPWTEVRPAACRHDDMIAGAIPARPGSRAFRARECSSYKAVPLRRTSQSPVRHSATETPLILSRRCRDRKIEIGVRKWLGAQRVVPPLLLIILEAVRQH